MARALQFAPRVFSALASWAAAITVVGALGLIVFDILAKGLPGLSWEFFSAPPENSGRAGGISTILASTGLVLAVCLGVCIPLGLGTATFLSEFASHTSLFSRLVRRSLDVLAGVPSIVFGLFGNVLFCKVLGLGFSVLSGGLTLACMVLPLFIRLSEQSLRAVPGEYRTGGAALAMSRTSILRLFVLPAALPSLVAALVLSTGRAIAETAALIFTSGYVDRMPESLLDSGRVLSIHIYDLAMNVPGGDTNAQRSALALLVLILLVNSAAYALTHAWLKRRGDHA